MEWDTTLMPDYISVSEAAVISGLTTNIIQDRARKGKIEGLKKVRGVYLIPKEWAIQNKKKPSVSEMARSLKISRVTAYKKLRGTSGMDKRDVAYAFGRLYAIMDIMTGNDKGITKHYNQYMMFPGQQIPEMLRVVNSKKREDKYERLLEEIMGTLAPEDMTLRLSKENQSALIIGQYHEYNEQGLPFQK